MNDKEYIDKICCKCENKSNDKDLCDIRQTINGEYKCVNEKLPLYDNEFTTKAVVQYTSSLNDENAKEFVKEIEKFATGKYSDEEIKNIVPIPLGATLTPLNIKLADNKMLNYKEENKTLIENGKYKYYDFTEEIINNIINKKINDVTNDEWRTLLQMLYPKNMIGSGLFQPILVFEIDKNGKRKDPPVAAYNSINDLKRNLIKADCLLFRIMDYIEKNSNLKINESWYKEKEKILREE